MHQAITRARGLDVVSRARHLADLADSGTAVLSLTEMEALGEEALTEGRDLHDDASVSGATTALGQVALARGEYAAAVDLFAEALRLISSQTLDTTHVACALAIAKLRLGDLGTSRSLLVDAMPHARTVGITWLGLTALEAAADWLGDAGQSEPAVTCWGAIDAVRSRTLDRTGLNDMGIFERPRERDRQALTPGALEVATAAGRGMTLDQALAFAMELVAAKTAPYVDGRKHGVRHDLTPREHEVLALVAAGRSDGQIADALFISKKTAAVHVGNIKSKLGANSRVEIVTIALRSGLVAGP
jgi:DNA-binding CsgD family transcriptional regulator